MTFQSFEDLEVWKRACKLAVYTYESLKTSRDFSLRDQMQRDAVSIASNIAEGSERTEKDFLRFLSIARGSSSELRTQAYISFKIKLIDQQQMNLIVDETKQINRMLTGLAQSIQKKLNTEH
ncbi:MAG: four helix bundle protein [Planctomycetaceae bacterium]